MVCLVLLGTFALVSLLLSGLVALVWRTGLSHTQATSADLVALRLLPVAGGLVIALAVVLPAFVSFEPQRDRETAGPLLAILATFALLTLGHGIWRGGRACAAANALRRTWGPAARWIVESGHKVRVVGVGEPIVAVVGAWRPHIVAAESVLSACSADEFRQVIAHEVAHLSARDNLKLLLLVASPDVLAWTPLGTALVDRWRAAAEREADQRAAGSDPQQRIALASALIKVARLLSSGDRVCHALSMSGALDDVEGRVRQLLAPPDSRPATMLQSLVWCALLAPVVALPLHPLVHELIEALVRFGL
jgi:hypothetical protein